MKPARELWATQTFGDPSAPALVLLHSIATRGAVWAPQWPILSERFRVLVPDMPGHGETPVDRSVRDLDGFADGLVRLLDAHRIQKVALVGLSLGGMVAQGFALRHPDRLSALVLHTPWHVFPRLLAMHGKYARALRLREACCPRRRRHSNAGSLRTSLELHP